MRLGATVNSRVWLLYRRTVRCFDVNLSVSLGFVGVLSD